MDFMAAAPKQNERGDDSSIHPSDREEPGNYFPYFPFRVHDPAIKPVEVMMKRSWVFLLLFLLLLSACALARDPGQASPPIAGAEPEATLTQPAPPTPTVTEANPGAGLKPADSDTPAAGICGKAQGEIMPIVLGAGPDGLPLAGRCIIFAAEQRIQLVNGADAALVLDFAGYHVDLPAGGELLLDRPVGEYLALGVHFLSHGPEIWVK
jgi:hypothetical protein